MTHNEWLKEQRDLWYQQGRAWSDAGNAKTETERDHHKERAKRLDVAVKEHERAYRKVTR